MPSLAPGDVRVNTMLKNVGLRYVPTGAIGDMIFPIINVKNETDYYPMFPMGAWARDSIGNSGPTAPGGEGTDIGFNMNLDNTYQCEEYRARWPLHRRVRNNADSALQIQTRGSELCAHALTIARERRVAALVFLASTWGSGTDPTISTKWSDYVNSDPIGEIDTGIAAVEDNTAGHIANIAVIGVELWRVTRRHPEIIELCRGSAVDGNLIVTPQNFAAAFELDKVLIGRMPYTADEEIPIATEAPSGVQSTTLPALTKIWGKNMWIGHVSPANSMLDPSAGYQFRNEFRTRSFLDDRTETEYVESIELVDEKMVSARCGYYIPAAIS